MTHHVSLCQVRSGPMIAGSSKECTPDYGYSSLHLDIFVYTAKYGPRFVIFSKSFRALNSLKLSLKRLEEHDILGKHVTSTAS